MFDVLETAQAHRCLFLNDPPTGLRAIVALDNLDFGLAVGGVRTWAYKSEAEAVADSVRLARAMTLKCAIANLPAGGGKTVIIDHPGLDRREAFVRFGEYVEDLKGLYCCAGDLGTTQDDLLGIAASTSHVETRAAILSDAAGSAILNCIQACAEVRGIESVVGLKVAVQGCGSMGEAAARALVQAGAIVLLADIDREASRALADELGATAIPSEDVLNADVDVFAPCAIGGILDQQTARQVRAWAICGAANNQLASPEVAEILRDGGILYVPDFLASAGAVTAGVALKYMGAADYRPHIAELGATARHVLLTAIETRRTTPEVAQELAFQRIVERKCGMVN